MTCKSASAPGASWKHTNEICIFSIHYRLPHYGCVYVKGCCHVTATVTWSEPLAVNLCLALNAFRCTSRSSARWLSSLLRSPSLSSGTRSDFLLWMTTTLTRILYWHQPLQNNKHVTCRVSLTLTIRSKTSRPSGSAWIMFQPWFSDSAGMCPSAGGTQWFLTRYLNIWKDSRRTQLRRHCLVISPLGYCRNMFVQSDTFPGGKPASVNVLFYFWMRAVPPKLATSALAMLLFKKKEEKKASLAKKNLLLQEYGENRMKDTPNYKGSYFQAFKGWLILSTNLFFL